MSKLQQMGEESALDAFFARERADLEHEIAHSKELHCGVRPEPRGGAAMELNESNARVFVGVGVEKTAYFNPRGGAYKPSWGDQSFAGAHYTIVLPFADGTPGFDIYGCDIEAFEKTHKAVAGKPNTWTKTVRVLALQLTEPRSIETIVNNTVESVTEAAAGDWLVKNPTGETYIVKPAQFEMLYRAA